MGRTARNGYLLAAAVLLVPLPLMPQSDAASLARQQRLGVGDSAAQPRPLARDLSPKLHPQTIAKAMHKVGDWELARSRPYFSQDWTFAALYAGFVEASSSLPDVTYRNAMLDVGNKFSWTLGPRQTHADDQAIGQTYLALYAGAHDPRMIAPTQKQFDRLMTLPDDPAKPVWWWCDALFMAPPVWARLAHATGQRAYLDYMDRQWWVTSTLLYDPAEHLYSRDATFLEKREKNGNKIFWARGNGWVMAGLARVLQEMPEDYPTRKKYEMQFREMAATIAALQSRDGLWRPGLLDADAYPLPEVSGSSFFVYALAWGIDHHLLDRKTYLPVVKRGWRGLLSHVYEDGRLGSIQPIGAAPDAFQPTSSYVYGVGAFLLAGSELLTLEAHSR